VVKLDLTILASTASSLDVSITDSYTSPSGKVWTESGIYHDTIANAVGCDSVITINLTIIPVGIGDYYGNQDLHYYPNPVDQELIIEFAREFEGTIELLDMNGRVLMQERRSRSLRTTLNTSRLTPGSYVVKMTGAHENYLLRIIKY
jgi:hypothetical protein